jgi:6-pyruvoyltetrahydropterin/6-carboxytetrahydropterin synthase
LRAAALAGPALKGMPVRRATREIWRRLRAGWSEPPKLVLLELQTTPYLTCAVHRGEPEMLSVTQCFEFAASHRLACPDFTEQRNREVFGKCANPNGHGHNYGLEITVRIDPASGDGPFSLAAMEAVTKSRVLDRFDHKYLNADCIEFADLNPSVENISRVIWGLLKGRIEGAELANVRVWETGKTCADYSE